MYYKKCSVTKIPLYLIVAGSLILLNIGYHILIGIFERFSTRHKRIFVLARRADFFLFFPFVWLIVGSVWILHTAFRGGSNCDCGDCPFGLYLFATMLIISQYVYVLISIIACFVFIIKSRCS